MRKRGLAFTYSIRGILGILWLAPFCVSAKDLGMFYGEPTPSLAMFTAQMGFAVDKCVADGLVEDVKGAKKIARFFDGNFKAYKKKDEEYLANFNTFYANYSTAWDVSSLDVHRSFCEGLNREIETKGFMWPARVLFVKGKFTPRSEKSARRANLIVGALSIVPVAGSLSASHDSVSAAKASVSSAKAGNFAQSNAQLASSNMLMAQSHDISQIGASLSGMAVAGLTKSEYGPLIAVMDERDADGTLHTRRCPVVEHFLNYDAPLDSPVWTTYQRVGIACRNPVEADLTRLE